MPITRVAVGLVWHEDRIVVGRRGAGGVLAGLDEFPGGKCRPEEDPAETVVREVWEETGLHVGVVGLRDRVVHAYAYGAVELFFFDCEPKTESTQAPLLTAPFEWRQVEGLSEAEFPEANRSVLAAIRQFPGCRPPE